VGTRTGAERRHSGCDAGDVEVCVATGNLKREGMRGAAGAGFPCGTEGERGRRRTWDGKDRGAGAV
jgi:hypothetical protein